MTKKTTNETKPKAAPKPPKADATKASAAKAGVEDAADKDKAADPAAKTAEQAQVAQIKQTKADAAKARQAGLSASETSALDPENRVPRVRVAEDDAVGSQHTDEEIVAAKGASTVTLTSFVITIERDPMIKIGKRLFEHEIPILEALHGSDKISVDEDSARDEQVTFSAEQEYDRLVRTRGEKGAKALRLIYPNATALAEDLGLAAPKRRSFVRNRLQERQQSAQRGAGV